MSINSIEDYKKKELRLKEINDELEALTQKNDVNIEDVIKLRKEAKELAKELKQYLNKVLNIKKQTIKINE